MAALLVGMSIMAILMGAALPVWNKQAQREREEEYLFRANEYARAVMKFQARVANAMPPNFDVLVEQKFLRRKYKDPLTGQDFQPVYMTVTQPGGPGTPSGAAGAMAAAPNVPPSTGSGQGQGAPIPGAGVIGVVSKSKGTSIKIYNGRTRYDQWAVTYQDVKLGKGLPPDLLQGINAAAAAARGAAGGQAGAGAFGTPSGGQPGMQPAAPGANPFGQPGANPFGQPGTNPFGQPGMKPSGPGANPFAPAYPPPPGAGTAPSIFAPPKKVP